MLREFKADFHIHSCLSPCGDIQMTPKMIVEQAKSAGLDAICICDHNSSENSATASKVGKEHDISFLFGMEVNSKEEVHILALFDDENSLKELQKTVYENLPGENDDDTFGYQMIINDQDEIADLNPRLLIGATDLSIETIVGLIHDNGGLAIASHVDRERFSLIGQLGFIPPDLKLDGVEVSPNYILKSNKYDFPMAPGLTQVTFSDAHFVHDIGKTFTTFNIEKVSVSEIKKALENKDGRSVVAYS